MTFLPSRERLSSFSTMLLRRRDDLTWTDYDRGARGLEERNSDGGGDWSGDAGVDCVCLIGFVVECSWPIGSTGPIKHTQSTPASPDQSPPPSFFPPIHVILYHNPFRWSSVFHTLSSVVSLTLSIFFFPQVTDLSYVKETMFVLYVSCCSIAGGSLCTSGDIVNKSQHRTVVLLLYRGSAVNPSMISNFGAKRQCCVGLLFTISPLATT
jgi:hypothetical protein